MGNEKITDRNSLSQDGYPGRDSYPGTRVPGYPNYVPDTRGPRSRRYPGYAGLAHSMPRQIALGRDAMMIWSRR
eukprot:421131-Rhodomonas_salina.1